MKTEMKECYLIYFFQVIIYCDLHGHSRKPNVFMYGCTADLKMASMSNFVEERLFPWMMSQKVLKYITLSVPRLTNINFLRTISVHNQEKRLQEFLK